MRLPVGAHVWPDNGRPELIRLAYHCIVRHDNPFAVEPHAIVATLRIPIDVVDPEAVGKGAAESVAARKPVEPGFQRRIGIPAIVARECHDPPAANGQIIDQLLADRRARRWPRSPKFNLRKRAISGGVLPGVELFGNGVEACTASRLDVLNDRQHVGGELRCLRLAGRMRSSAQTAAAPAASNRMDSSTSSANGTEI